MGKSIYSLACKNPFFIEALKEMNPSYEPPTRELLSGHVFEAILNKKKYLILGM